MLNYLLIMRHAKSSWANADLTDHARPLNKRGRAAADAVARVLTVRGYSPDIIWSSDSARTKETATRLIRIIPGAQSIRYFPEFYQASRDDVLQVCFRETPKGVKGSEVRDLKGEPCKCLMLLGHNPAWMDLYDYFCEGDASPFTQFPTGACAVFKRRKNVSGEWYDPKVWRAADLLLPRNLDP